MLREGYINEEDFEESKTLARELLFQFKRN